MTGSQTNLRDASSYSERAPCLVRIDIPLSVHEERSRDRVVDDLNLSTRAGDGGNTFPRKAMHGIYLTRHGPSTLYRAQCCRARARSQSGVVAAAGARDRSRSISLDLGISSGPPHNCMHARTATARATYRAALDLGSERSTNMLTDM
jgi:hypothetical protein